jgi:hypothetical protein
MNPALEPLRITTCSKNLELPSAFGDDPKSDRSFSTLCFPILGTVNKIRQPKIYQRHSPVMSRLNLPACFSPFFASCVVYVLFKTTSIHPIYAVAKKTEIYSAQLPANIPILSPGFMPWDNNPRAIAILSFCNVPYVHRVPNDGHTKHSYLDRSWVCWSRSSPSVSDNSGGLEAPCTIDGRGVSVSIS